MRVIGWLTGIFVATIVLGACWWAAAGFITGANPTLEGLLGLAIFLTFVAFAASGAWLLIIGPAVLRDRFLDRPLRN
jgi:hypothetical protein